MSAWRSFRRANIFAGIIEGNIIIFLPSDILLSGRNSSICSSYVHKFSEASSRDRVLSKMTYVLSLLPAIADPLVSSKTSLTSLFLSLLK